MANALAEVVPKLLAQGLLALRQQSIMPRLVNRSYDAMAAERGTTVNVPIPSAVSATPVVPAATSATATVTDIVPTSAALILENWYEAAFALSDKEILEVMDGVLPMEASEAIKSLANVVDADIFAEYVGVYGFSGTGTTPFATDLSDYTNSRTVLNRQLAPMNDRRVVLSPDAEGNALLLRAFQDAGFGGGAGVILEGQIGRKVGADWWMSQNVPSHTAGTAAGATTNATGYAVGLKTITLATAGTGSILVGDIITFAGQTQTYAVTAGDASVADGGTISFEPGLVVAIPAAATAITLKASHAVNLHFHRDAIAFASRPLLDTTFEDRLVAMQSAVDPISGLTLRLEVTREHRRWKWAYDILWGAKLIRPALATRLTGGS
jgi:P22 coat protein - gene protein 5